MQSRVFAYAGRTFEVRAEQSKSSCTWPVQVWGGDKKAIGAFYSVTDETVKLGRRYGIDLLEELSATAISHFTTWSDRMKDDPSS